MLFNSVEFIALFFPVTLAGYWLLNRLTSRWWSAAWLIGASLVFYGWWNPRYVPLIVGSVLFNFFWGRRLGVAGRPARHRTWLLAVGLAFNLGLLGYFKYADFLIRNVNTVAGADLPLLRLVLPLAISFFTFQQIAYLVDTYRGEAREYSFVNYALFVTFFPQLIAGPIVHHKEMLPQFADGANRKINYENWARGLFLFMLGLFKKTVVADTCAVWATAGFDGASVLTFLEAWGASLSYTFQLYFDFSAYCDMAMGAALFFNIRLPVNFNSPYKALDIGDFWRRWHMTLSRCLRDYLYIPLGGNRRGPGRAVLNVMVTFLLGGLWHGAAWTFVFWGALHGAAVVISRLWQQTGRRLPKALAWSVTFLFVNTTWVFFRATTWTDAVKVLRGMLGMDGFVVPRKLGARLALPATMVSPVNRFPNLPSLSEDTARALLICAVVVLFARNSVQLHKTISLNRRWAFVTCVLGVWALFSLNKVSEFLYFNF